MKNEEMSNEKYHDYQKYVEDRRDAESKHRKEPEKFVDIKHKKYHDYQDYIIEKREQEEWEKDGWHQLPPIEYHTYQGKNSTKKYNVLIRILLFTLVLGYFIYGIMLIPFINGYPVIPTIVSVALLLMTNTKIDIKIIWTVAIIAIVSVTLILQILIY